MSSLILVRWNPDKKVTPPWRKFPPAAAGVSTGIFWQGDLQCHCVMTGFSELSPSRSPEREPPGVPHLPSYGKSRLPGRGFLLYQGSSPRRASLTSAWRTALPSVLQGFDMKITLPIIPAISLIREPRAAGTRCWGVVIKQSASGDTNLPGSPLVGHL